MKAIFKCCVCLVLLVYTGALTAQEPTGGVDFIDKPLDELLAQAKTAGKLVFIDCYSTYCPPCKLMLKKEFPKEEMGDYLNAGFISAKMNLDLGDGPRLAEKWDVHSFPTYLFMNAEGEILHRMAGYMEAGEFIKAAKEGLADNTFREMEKNYLAGNRSRELVVAYVEALGKMRRGTMREKVILDFLNESTTDLLADTLAYDWFCRHANSPYLPVFLKVYENRAAFAERYGAKSDRKLEQVWENYPRHFAVVEGEKFVQFDRRKLEEYQAYMNRHGVAGGNIMNNLLLSEACYGESWTDTRKLLRENYTREGVDEGALMYAFMQLSDRLEKKSEWKELKKMLSFRIRKLQETPAVTEDLYSGEQPFIPAQYIGHYEKMLENVESKLKGEQK